VKAKKKKGASTPTRGFSGWGLHRKDQYCVGGRKAHQTQLVKKILALEKERGKFLRRKGGRSSKRFRQGGSRSAKIGRRKDGRCPRKREKPHHFMRKRDQPPWLIDKREGNHHQINTPQSPKKLGC